jgi:hypothetical protein
MIRPRITFFCDLELEALQRLFADTAVIDDLLRLQAGVRLALLDLSPERADVVRRLNDAGIPVIAGLLLPRERGLFLTMENAPQVVARYTDFQAWTARNGLRWAGVGLDIELDVREFQRFASNTWQALLSRLRRGFDSVRLEQALAIGLTGRGAESEASLPLLDWDTFARDLLYAHRWSEAIAIFSLEGCVNQGFMERLKTFDWDRSTSDSSPGRDDQNSDVVTQEPPGSSPVQRALFACHGKLG